MLIDSHCHLDFPDFAAERDAVVARARAAGVKRMITISTWVSKFADIRALAQAAVWWRSGLSVPIAVNVSMRDIHAPNFVASIQEGLAKHGVPPAALQLEITERVLLQDPQRQTGILRDIVEPLAAAQQARRDAVAAKAAATRVQFFAMRNMRT